MDIGKFGSKDKNIKRRNLLWAKLKEKGIRLALDDFGTGYSNFHYLHDLRPDIIKIDRSFTAKALANDYEYNLLDLISGMVHTLNLNVCVEGIETEDERNRIQNLSPDYIQGFYFGKPCPYQQFTEQFVTVSHKIQQPWFSYHTGNPPESPVW